MGAVFAFGTYCSESNAPDMLASSMPFKSQAQRRKFAQLLVEGKISNDTFEEWYRETGGRKLPERVKRKQTVRAKPGRKNRRTNAAPGKRRR